MGQLQKALEYQLLKGPVGKVITNGHKLNSTRLPVECCVNADLKSGNVESVTDSVIQSNVVQLKSVRQIEIILFDF